MRQRAPRERAKPVLAPVLEAVHHSIEDEAEWADAIVAGDYSSARASLVEISGCRIESARFTGAELSRLRLRDCVVVDSELSGAVMEEVNATRVEFLRCRFSSLQAPNGRFADVAFVGCKLDDANFRFSEWDRAEFCDSDLRGADFYAAKLPNAQFISSDLRRAQVSKADLVGSRLHGSQLEGICGAEGLRGVSIGSDQIVPTALVVFAALAITVDDDPGATFKGELASS